MKHVQCSEKKDLVATYERATRKYSDAVSILNQNIGISAKDRYDAFYRLAEEARQLAHEARERLDKHAAGHGC